MTTLQTTPLLKSVVVARPLDDAFALFTERMGSWWPTDSHSIGGDKVTGVVFESRLDGRIYETTSDGDEYDWARVLVWEPPRRFVMSWHPSPDSPAATEVEVRFTQVGEGTRVDLEHRFWERLGDRAAEARADYDPGWDYVLAQLIAAV
ncbi:MAG: SRPBCC family protein [Actinomycetota bacterium]|nr:SRPBCC family protein [Actinomycetota bacterium]